MTICKHGLGSNQVDFGGNTLFWFAIENIVSIDGAGTKNMGNFSVWKFSQSNVIEGMNLMELLQNFPY